MSPVIHRDVVQGTPEWLALRAGKWSASKGAIIMGGLDTSGLASYIKDIAWERVYGLPPEDGFKSKAMERGNAEEPNARDWYAFDRDVVIEEVGFVEHARIPNLGWSPDGLYNAGRNAIEAKCPLHKAWMECKRTGKIPSEYRWQVKFGLFVGELDGLDFVSWRSEVGGIVIPAEITDTEKDQIEARICMLERKVQDWIDIIQN